MRKVATSLAVLAGALLLAACGGGGSSTATVGKNAATPRAAFRCLDDAGVPVKSTPPPNDSFISELVVAGDKPDQVLVWFAKSPKAAKSYAGDAAAFLSNGGGNADVVGKTIVVGTTGKANPQLDQIEECVTS
jgi:hypothetical protein